LKKNITTIKLLYENLYLSEVIIIVPNSEIDKTVNNIRIKIVALRDLRTEFRFAVITFLPK